MNFKKYNIQVPTIIFLLIVTSLPTLSLDYPSGHDWMYELVRVSEYKSALLQSQYPPYWADNLYGGLGSPIFVYYAPFYMFVTSSISFLTGQIESAGALALILFSTMGLIFMYLFIGELLDKYGIKDKRAVRIGLYFYALSPYLIADKFLRNANAEYAALSVAPLAFYGLILIQRRPFAGTIILSLGMALTIISHNLTALIIFSVALLAIAILYAKQRVQLFYALSGMLLSLCLSMFFWVPALYYKSLVRTEFLTTRKFDFHVQFKSFTQYFGFGEFYSVGPLPIIIITLGIAGYIWINRNRDQERVAPILLFCLVLASVFIFLLMSVSSPLWEHAPFLAYFQFPWRMMGPLALVTTVIAALLYAYSSRSFLRTRARGIELIILGVCLLNAAPYLDKAKTLSLDVESLLPELLSEEVIRYKLLPATVLDEYLPKSADSELLSVALSDNRPIIPTTWRSNKNKTGDNRDVTEDANAVLMARKIQRCDPVFIHSDGMSVILDRELPKSIVLKTSSISPGVIQLVRWYYPVWRVWVDSDSANAFADERGLLSIKVPAGVHEIRIERQSPEIRQYTVIISIAGIAVWVMMVIMQVARHRIAISRTE